MKITKKQLLFSVIALIVSISMLIGTTFAWFVDVVSSGRNIITSGNLDIEMYWSEDPAGPWYNVEDPAYNTIFDYSNWEPGYTDVKYIKIKNNGELALNYELAITPDGSVGKLAEVINVHYATDAVKVTDRDDLQNMGALGLLKNVLNGRAVVSGTLMAEDQLSYTNPNSETIVTLAMTMITTAGNAYQNEDAGKFSITAVATQAPVEEDSFGAYYDSAAELPIILTHSSVSGVVNNSNNKTAEETVISGNGVSAVLPAGVDLVDDAERVTLTVTPLEKTTSDIVVVNQEVIIPVDVHIEGVDEDNQTPIIVNLGPIMPKYLNLGNYNIYHVEDGVNKVMTLVDSAAELTTHNTFTYDPLTGEVSVAMQSFSEVALVADIQNVWNGSVAKEFSGGTGAAEDPHIIANADQLAYMGYLISNYNGDYGAQNYKLIADVDFGGRENTSNAIFYPIGYNKVGGEIATIANDLDEIYFEPINPARPGDKDQDVTAAIGANSWYTYGGSFRGVFDGAGHTVSGIYQNTWAMKGDYDGHYYNEAMGLFGYVNGGTVKNLIVNNFASEGEFAPTGCVTAYAGGTATFENITVINSHPQTYNTGVAGIVGWDNGNNTSFTFKNITVDATNTVSALWGSWDVAASGILGSLKNESKANFDNCHVAATIDVYNDVCGNYQYYWYRYSGAFIGTVYRRLDNGNGALDLEYGVSAKNCSANFGDANNVRHEYYYCEFIENTKASYTHDYQMSRVPIDEIKGTGEAAECIGHDHESHGKETINGESVLIEDKQAIYLPYRQLFGGYGWGVDGVDLNEYENIGITDLTTAEEKFVAKVEPNEEYESDSTVKVGDIFEAIENANIQSLNVQVTVSPVIENGVISPAGGIFVADTDNWENGTITFTGRGAVEIIISDYYFCKPTRVIVNVVEPQDVEKFTSSFNGDLLYRVGNGNEVKIGSLFAESEEISKAIKDDSVTVTVNSVDEMAGVSGTYTPNASNWKNGTVKFTGTGVVSVTITDNNHCIPHTIYLEVVDAKNVTAYSDLKDGQDSVFLNDIAMSSGGSYRLTNNHVIYGNGFTFDVTNGAYTGVQYDYASYVIYLENSRIDNLVIKGAVYPEVGASKTDNYNRAIVMTSGDCSIVNSFVSNGASPIRNGGNLNLVNTTLKGGAYANLDLRNGHLILDNVTTVNQIGANDKYGDNEIVGMGIVVYQEGGTDELKITVKNKLTQYNYLSKTEADKHLENAYASQIKNVVFGNDFSDYQNNGLVNFGIISMNNYFTKDDLVDERSDKAGYVGKSQTITLLGQSRDCYVYTAKPASSSAVTYPGYVSGGQGVIAPAVQFDFKNKNYQQKVDGSNDYCYEDNGKVFVSMDEGETFNWDTGILTATKNGHTLAYTVEIDGVDYTGKSIALNKAGEYKVEYFYTDPYNFNKDLSCFDVAYKKTVEITVSVVKAAAKNAVFSFGANGTAYSGKTVTIGDKTYVMPDVSATVSGKIGSKTVNGVTVYYPITEMYTSDGVTAHKGSWYACFPIFKDALQIVDYADKGTGDSITYNQSTVTTVDKIPSTLKATDPKTAFLYSMNATNYPPPTEPTATSGAVCYTSNRSGLTASNERKEENTVAEYTYTDNAGKTYYYFVGYHCAEQTNGCVTPDTLITLADGTQKRVDSLTGEEMLLVWNLETGKYEAAPIVFIDFDEETEYEIIHLFFSNGADVKVISEHGFFDIDLGKYVYIDADNYAQYIGHRFVTEGDIASGTWSEATLDNVVIEKDVTTAWSPVTFGHLCYYTNGVLSMPGGIDGLFNIFEVDTDTMSYDEEKMLQDIETYGLFTLEDFGGMIPEIAFEAFNGDYLKVAIAKGMLTWEDIAYLAERYVPLV